MSERALIIQSGCYSLDSQADGLADRQDIDEHMKQQGKQREGHAEKPAMKLPLRTLRQQWEKKPPENNNNSNDDNDKKGRKWKSTSKIVSECHFIPRRSISILLRRGSMPLLLALVSRCSTGNDNSANNFVDVY